MLTRPTPPTRRVTLMAWLHFLGALDSATPETLEVALDADDTMFVQDTRVADGYLRGVEVKAEFR